MKEFIIGRNDAGQRLDRFVSKAAPLIPESLLQKTLRKKDIKINGRPAKGETRLAEGDTVRVYLPDEFFEAPREENAWRKITAPRLDIVYEDENILLVDKKPGVLCHSAGEWSWNTLIANIQAYLRAKGEWDPARENSFAPALCNRIDRNTGGVVILAKNAEALRVMNEKIRNGEVKKFYLAAVHGILRKKSDTLLAWLKKNAATNTVRIYTAADKPRDAKRIATRYRVLAEKNGDSLIEVELLTGRTHQIRAQFAEIGHPLLGDGKYGVNRDDKRRGYKFQALYAYRLRFDFADATGALGYLCGREYRLPEGAVWFVSDFME